MTNLRLIVPAALVAQVLALLRELGAVTNVVHLPGAGVEPAGDLIIADVAREDVSLVVERLCALGLDETGAIAIDAVDASVSLGARRAMRDARGLRLGRGPLGAGRADGEREQRPLASASSRSWRSRPASRRSGSSPTRRS